MKNVNRFRLYQILEFLNSIKENIYETEYISIKERNSGTLKFKVLYEMVEDGIAKCIKGDAPFVSIKIRYAEGIDSEIFKKYPEYKIADAEQGTIYMDVICHNYYTNDILSILEYIGNEKIYVMEDRLPIEEGE